MDVLVYWVWIVMSLGPANSRIWDILNEYDDIEEAYSSITAGRCRRITQSELHDFQSVDINQAEKIIEYCIQKGINVICYDDETFPQRLREIYNPPAVLFMYGDISYIDNSVALAVVGARKPSDYSVKIAENIVSELAKVGTVIISGFAYGIDSVAHKAALECRTNTIAVLGCGIDYDYPEGNAQFKKVIGKCGAVITEYFPGTRPVNEYFRQRNRLISALSLGVLVVEASEKSGSLNTASHALSQGRDIFCIPPHDITDKRYAGVINLIRDGAISVFSHLDVMYEYYENFSHKLYNTNPYESYIYKSESALFASEKVTTERKKVTKNKTIDKSESETDIKADIDYSKLNENQSRIVEVLKPGILIADEISEKLDIDISDVLSELTELELLGIVKSLAGKRYSL